MKWRTVLLYGVILCILIGYFYYFEVVKEKQRKETLKAQKKVFQLVPEKIVKIEITPRDGNKIVLEKDEKGKWIILKPVKTLADQASVKGLLNVMKELETEKWIDLPENADLKNYGLDSPRLKILAVAKNATYELTVGDKNPAETEYYAKASGKNKIFLVDSGRWEVLNKNLFDLRQKELASFDNDKVARITISWNNNTTIEVIKKGNRWFAPSNEKMKIKKTKVENVLDQVRWLRARKFLSAENPDLAKFGLDNPEVKISIVMDDNTTIHQVAIGRPPEKDKNAKDFLVAYSKELPFVVYIDKDILDEMPKTLRDLEDRSLFVWEEDDIHELVWHEKGKTFDFVRIDEAKWGIRPSEKEKPREFKDSWRIRSLLWELEDLEYNKAIKPAPPVPENPMYVLTFADNNGNELGKWMWEKVSESDNEEITIWIEENKKVKAVTLKASDIKEVIDKAQNLIEAANKKEKKNSS